MNLAVADVMIHVVCAPHRKYLFIILKSILQDVCWSDQDMRQINGRIYRQPQDKTVHVIHLLAEDTSDMVMFSMAKRKKAMLETFVNRNPEQQGMHDFI